MGGVVGWAAPARSSYSASRPSVQRLRALCRRRPPVHSLLHFRPPTLATVCLENDSLSMQVRLSTSAPGAESGSAQK